MPEYPVDDPLDSVPQVENPEINFTDTCEELILRRRIIMIKICPSKGGAVVRFENSKGDEISGPFYLSQNTPEVTIRTAAVLKEGV